MANIAMLQRVPEAVWELPTSYKAGMRVPARIYGTEKLVQTMDDAVYDQITNVATLPGITQYAPCMPDGHSQIPPDLVVKSQAIDSTGVILSPIRRPKVVQTLHRNRKSRLELLFISEAHRSTTKSVGM